jgi:rod shape-determining protein MreC
VPRQRTARLAVLGSSHPGVDRSRQRAGRALRARLVALALVLVSLALLTVYFRESSGGTLHGAQRIVASVVAPFEVAAERVARPFRDGYSYASDLFGAKAENARLHDEIDALRRQAVENKTAAEENDRLVRILQYIRGPDFPRDYEPVVTRVIVRPQSVFRQEVVVAAGSNHGVSPEDPVVTPTGLVGVVTEVTASSSKVRLLTDQQSAASATVLETGAAGVVLHGPSDSSTLVLDRVAKDALVEKGNIVITAGSREERFESLFPRGIPIGVVTAVSQRDVDLYKRVQVTALVDFDSLDEVIVLAARQGGSAE